MRLSILSITEQMHRNLASAAAAGVCTVWILTGAGVKPGLPETISERMEGTEACFKLLTGGGTVAAEMTLDGLGDVAIIGVGEAEGVTVQARTGATAITLYKS